MSPEETKPNFQSGFGQAGKLRFCPLLFPTCCVASFPRNAALVFHVVKPSSGAVWPPDPSQINLIDWFK